MIVQVEFTERVTYRSKFRLTAAQVEEAYQQGGIDDDARQEEKLSAIEAWLKMEHEPVDRQTERWFELLDAQVPNWPMESDVEVTDRDLDAVRILDERPETAL